MRTLIRRSLLLVAVLGATSLILPTGAFAFSGMLSAATSGILGAGNWLRNPITFSWNVTQNTDGTWHYSYVFSHASGGTNEMIVEAPVDFTAQDLSSVTGNFGSLAVGLFRDGTGDPGIPSSFHGIKFDNAAGTTTHLAFDTSRVPAWGDFYSKGGAVGEYGQNLAFNTGFLPGEDFDPSGAGRDGSAQYHVLVPGQAVNPVPEPASVLLLGGGLLGLGFGWKHRRA